MSELDSAHRAWLEEALARQLEGNGSAALLAYRRYFSRVPGSGEAWSNFSALLRGMGRATEALEAAQQATAAQPDSADAHANQGNALGDLERWAEAREAFLAALALDPGHPGARVNLGWTLYREGRLEEALAADEEALRRHPGVPEVHLNLGFTLLKLGRLEDAERAFLASLDRDPVRPLAHWNLAFVRLLQGRWKAAWPHYLWRMKLPEAQVHARSFEEPEWNGEPFQGRTLLVWAEQGFGDTIQFVRFLPEVKRRGGKVLLQAQAALLGLLESCDGADRVLGEHEDRPPFDLQIPVLSLPAALAAEVETLPAEVPYLTTPDHLRVKPPQHLAQALAPVAGTLRVGLVWSGNPNQKDNPTRSIDPALFGPLVALSGVRWFGLQRAVPGFDPGRLPDALRATDLAPFLATFSETAWVLENLDLLITVDSAPAHLAGALGIPVLTLLSFSPDWRWFWGREDSPFYPTMKLYRQRRPGDWEGVIARLVADLR